MDAKPETGKKTKAATKKSRFKALWEKAANPLTPVSDLVEANRELLKIQEEYWSRRDSDSPYA